MVPCVTTPPNNWHRFRDTDEGDEQCSRCGVVVDWEAHMTFTMPCPAGDCPSAKNPDRGCVFVPSKDSACRCIYCGRSGDRDQETEPEVPEDLEAELDAEAAAEDEDATAATLALLDRVVAGDVLTFNLGSTILASAL